MLANPFFMQEYAHKNNQEESQRLNGRNGSDVFEMFSIKALPVEVPLYGIFLIPADLKVISP